MGSAERRLYWPKEAKPLVKKEIIIMTCGSRSSETGPIETEEEAITLNRKLPNVLRRNLDHDVESSNYKVERPNVSLPPSHYNITIRV